jgi:xanthine dehydrogenase accessory factor
VNELQLIVNAYTGARARGVHCALATVVGVEGSAYRRPGARMLLTEDGRTFGTISGGCLERDVAERAASIFGSRDARLITYDTRGDEEIVWGLGLGCNGVVRVLLESLREGSEGERALLFVDERLRSRSRGVCATVVAAGADSSTDVDSQGGAGRSFEAGARVLFDDKLDAVCESFVDDDFDDFAARVRSDALEALAGGRSRTRIYEARGRRVEIFYDVIRPPRPLVVFGAEQDALPLVRQARAVGWRVTIVDTRARRASVERFAEADEVLLCRAEEVGAHVPLSEETAAVVMTHNFLDDVELLRALLPSPACYLGVLGPKQRTSKLLAELGAGVAGHGGSRLARLHGPAGVDIGAETPEEIALSIVAEIKAVCAARGGGFLRDRDAPIHGEAEAKPISVGAAAALSEVASEPRVPPVEGARLVACRLS